MSRGQQGIGISAAGMYGMLTTGKPVKIISRLSLKKPAHYYEIQIDTKKNIPEILNGKGEGVDIPPGQAGVEVMKKHGIEWVTHYDPPAEGQSGEEVSSGTRVTIEQEGKYQRGRGSVDEYLQQTAIANPHVTLHYIDPENNRSSYLRSTTTLPAEPKEIKPHPYGVELGRLVTMLKSTKATTITQFLTDSFSRVSSSVARSICDKAKVSSRASVRKIGREEADSLYKAIQATKISAPATDCVIPIGEELLLKGLHQVVPGEFYCASTRPPAVYRGNPFQIEVALAYGGTNAAQKVPLELLQQLLQESDARTLRQFLINTFDGMGGGAADKIIKEAEFGTRKSPGKLTRDELKELHHAMRNVNVSEGQSIQVLRYANRVPLQFKQRDCAITEAVIGTNWRVVRTESVPRMVCRTARSASWCTSPACGCRSPANRRRRSPAIRKSKKNFAWGCRPSEENWACICADDSGPLRKANVVTSSCGIWAKWPPPSARSTAPIAMRSTSACWKSPKRKRPKPTRSTTNEAAA